MVKNDSKIIGPYKYNIDGFINRIIISTSKNFRAVVFVNLLRLFKDFLKFIKIF